MRPLFIFILVFIVMARTYAQEIKSSCSVVNLTTKNQIFDQIPVFDQAAGQICFSFTASELIEGERVLRGHKYLTSEAINPLSLALSYAISEGAKDLQQGGVSCLAVEHARNNPICTANKSFQSSEEINHLISDFKDCKENKNKICEAILKKLNKNLNILKQENPLLYVKEIESSRCSDKDKIHLNIPPCHFENDESKSSQYYKEKVDNIFNSPLPKPIEIGYSMHLLSYSGNENKKYQIKREIEPDGILFSLTYKPHSSILLGRKLGKNGQCQYLLRNTQGISFCPIGITDRLGWECDIKSGGIWINQTELFDSVFQVSSIETD